MNIPAVVTPPYIYHVLSTQKALWVETFTLGEFTHVNMKSFGRQHFRKHREIKNGDNYITLDISLKFGSLEKMKIISSEPKVLFWKISKGVDYLYMSQYHWKVKD